ncbi:MFS transporter [Gymnodinialimonas hymeniacidonis]|uniref:MFS transporter n=1 Tax=Gymnodinialimonas hymeniacidonis TaxID=3126508 RepID=UPI0034C604B6
MPPLCAPEARRWVLVSAILASALGFIDGTIISIALPAIRDGLNADLVQGQWINNAYLLPLSALILLGGAVGDRFGLARSFIIGIAVFIVASIICALAPTPEVMIAGRVLKGLGAAVMVPGSLALIARAYPPEERGRAIGFWAAASSLTTAMGPILGGVALSLGGPEVWRWLFAINLPLGVLAIWLLARHVAADPSRPDHPLDVPGAVLISAALALLTFGLTGGASWPLLSLGAGLLAAFLWWEAHSPNPMVPLALFKNPTFSAANLATFLIYFALTTVLFFLPMTLIAGWQTPEALAAAAFAPLSVFISLLSARAGTWADRYGAGRMIGTGGALVALSFVLLALLAPFQDFWLSVLPGTALMGLGMALVVSPLSTAIMGSVPDERSGTGSGLNNAVSRVGGLIAVAVMGSVAAQAYTAAGGTGSFGGFSGTSGHADAMTAAFQLLCWIVAALTAMGATIAYWAIPVPETVAKR